MPATTLQMTPLSPLNPKASHHASVMSPYPMAMARPGAPVRKVSFPPSRPLRPHAMGPKPLFQQQAQANAKKTKIIEAPKSFPGGCGFFVLNMTNDELARRA